MTKAKDGITYPYEWADPQQEYWAIHGQKTALNAFEDLRKDDPWSNGRYALAAVAWGLIILVVFGVGAGP